MAKIDLSLIEHTPQSKKKKKQSAIWSNIKAQLNKDLTLTGKKLSNKKKLVFYNYLNVLLSSGIDLRSALSLIPDNYKRNKDRSLIAATEHDVIQGSSLSNALANTGYFSLYEQFSVQIGEETGKLTKVLSDLADYYKKKIEQNRKVTSAFAYPAIVILTAIAAVVFMMNFIVPMFEDIFSRYDRELPAVISENSNV